MSHTPNVIYISGNTYPHINKLNEISFFDSALNCWIAPISKEEQAAKVCDECKLTFSKLFQSDFVEPVNEVEWEWKRTDGQIKLRQLKILKLESEKDELENSGNIDIQNSRIQEIQISISELRDGLALLQEKKTRLDEEKKQGKVCSFRFLSLADMRREGEDWLKRQPPAQPMLLKRNGIIPTLPKGIVALLVGISGGGKTRFNTQLAFCLAAGINFFDYFQQATEKGYGRVFLGLGEEPSNNIWRRFKKVVNHYSPPEGDLINGDKERKLLLEQVADRLFPYSFYSMDARFIDENGLATPGYYEFLKALKKAEGDEGFDLIILDPVSRFQGSKTETDNDNATKFIALLERITQEVKGNPTVLISHHMPKGVDKKSQEAARGSSALTAGARWQMNMWTPDYQISSSNNSKITKYAKGFLALDVVKTNDCPYLDNPILVRFNENGILVPATEAECKAAELKPGEYIVKDLQSLPSNGSQQKQKQQNNFAEKFS